MLKNIKWRCPIENCPLGNPIFDTREQLKEHIKKYHRNKINEQLAKLKSRTYEKMHGRVKDTKKWAEEWACGMAVIQGMVKV